MTLGERIRGASIEVATWSHQMRINHGVGVELADYDTDILEAAQEILVLRAAEIDMILTERKLNEN